MVISLSNADFSALNIGYIEIQRKYNRKTEEAIIASGNTGMTTLQKNALDVFFEKIGAFDNSGIAAKLQKLYIPFMANDLSHAFVNYLTNEVDVEVSSEHLEYRNRGLVSKLASSSTSIKYKVSEGLNVNMADFSCFWGFTRFADLQPTTFFYPFIASTQNEYFYGLRMYNGSHKYNLIDTNYRNVEMRAFGSTSNTASFGACSDAQKAYGITDDGEIYSNSHTMQSNSNSKPVYVLASDYTGKLCPAADFNPIGFMALGKCLTQEEMVIFKSAIDTLMKVFL